jgi:hypothetical protein
LIAQTSSSGVRFVLRINGEKGLFYSQSAMHSELAKCFTEGTRITYNAGFVNNRRQILQAVLAARGDVRNHITQDVRRKNGGSNAALALRGRLRLFENASHGTRN